MLSLSARLIVSASAVLTAFLGLAGLALDRAFSESAMAGVHDRLQARVYALIASAELDENTLSLPDNLPEARLSVPQSGVYAQVTDDDNNTVWRSRSALGIEISYPMPGLPGVAEIVESNAGGNELFLISYAVHWALPGGGDRRFVFHAAENREPYEQEISRFRASLWTWLAGVAVFLLAVQGLVLRWSLTPLRRVAKEISDIEAGRIRALAGRYPDELTPLTDNLNLLVNNSATQLARYRNALADLAHSLKTPLAVLRNEIEELPESSELRKSLGLQIQRMDRTVQYQLQRAAASGRTALAPSIRIIPVVERIRDSLLKVYADKRLEFETELSSDLVFRGDEGDLTELLGNLLDNACKWCRQRVRLSGMREKGELSLVIEDDGPGLSASSLAELRQRGARGDTSVPGQGIGLAIVDELVSGGYGGSMELDRSPLGGARIRVTIKSD